MNDIRDELEDDGDEMRAHLADQSPVSPADQSSVSRRFLNFSEGTSQRRREDRLDEEETSARRREDRLDAKWAHVQRNRYIHTDIRAFLAVCRWPRGLYHLAVIAAGDTGTFSYQVGRVPQSRQVLFVGMDATGPPDALTRNASLALPEKFPWVDPEAWEGIVRKTNGGEADKNTLRKTYRRSQFVSWAPQFVSPWFLSNLIYVTEGVFGLHGFEQAEEQNIGGRVRASYSDVNLKEYERRLSLSICRLLCSSHLAYVLMRVLYRSTWTPETFKGGPGAMRDGFLEDENDRVQLLRSELRRSGWTHPPLASSSDDDEGAATFELHRQSGASPRSITNPSPNTEAVAADGGGRGGGRGRGGRGGRGGGRGGRDRGPGASSYNLRSRAP